VKAVTAFLLAAGLIAAPVSGQFRVATDLVSVYATVQEPSGRLVPDLREADFEVTDNGKAQPIALFSSAASPFSVVLLLDRSASMVQHRGLIRDAAAAFIERMKPEDSARIGSINTRITILPAEFTSDRAALFDALAKPAGGGASPVWVAVDQSITALYGLTGRRVILVLSDGRDEPSGYYPTSTFKAVADRVRRSGVMVYAVGFPLRGNGGRVEKPNRKLREVAELSGGGYFEMAATADLPSLFARVAEELHHQYWLGFVPPKRDGRFHDIKVKVKRPGLVARARPSYLAPAQ
jgi:Ca-activated chloride channel family protein